ncbi:CLUMA_CG016887, isoform A [Clunio marinus]|uniref:CLUMA_CG016887, isoform A n=1 Tax=Clunio marinus TaxID=568069 RepID=A0A1J1IT44_9DIPT|nr:CLUMA_CG016887, isoform A [Clunio marinus]
MHELNVECNSEAGNVSHQPVSSRLTEKSPSTLILRFVAQKNKTAYTAVQQLSRSNNTETEKRSLDNYSMQCKTNALNMTTN